MSSIVEIIQSYKNYFTATSEQKITAASRVKTCKNCEHFTANIICGLCGCPIAVKAFSPYADSCPAGKWEQ